MKFWKFLLTAVSVVFASIGTLLFQPAVFCEITIPVTGKILGWKAQALSARLSAFGTLEIQGLEAVDEKKSRIALDSAKVEFDPVRLVTGRPEILRADFRFAMVDLEVFPGPEKKKKAVPFAVPFPLREASVELVEGRLRTETGAWILKSAHASAEGWDGETPREIRMQLGRLDWNGPGQQELVTTTQATAKKSKDPAGGDLWEVKLATDVSAVVDLPPWNLVSPCQLIVEGTAQQNAKGDWRVDDLKTVWQGVGGIRVAAKIGGTYTASGEWSAELDLEPTDLHLAGIFLQPRGIQNVYGILAGTVNLHGGPQKPLGVGIEFGGQNVQLAAAGGVSWPVQPAALGISVRAEWQDAVGSLAVESLSMNLGKIGQPADFQLSLDRPAVLQLTGNPKAQAAEPASLQWAVRGLELAAVAPVLVNPANLKLEGGKLSAKGQATIEGEKVGLSGKAESRSLSATGGWVQGKLVVQSATMDFQGYVEKTTKIHLESAQVRVAWEGGAAEDLEISAKAEWDWARGEGFVAGNLATGLTGLGQAWAGAKFWPAEGQAKGHLEFSGNFAQKGSGLLAMTLSGMRWPGETGSPWGAKLSSEVLVEQGTWTLPELGLQADRAGDLLLDGRISALWKTGQDMGRVQVQLAKAESAFLVPLLKNFTPKWQWTEASGNGSFEFTRENRHDWVKADLQAAVTVETGTPQRPRPVDFSSVQGNLQASWPSGAQGQLAIGSLSLVAKHRDGTEAVRASLDAPLFLKKRGAKQWEPAGTQASSGMVQFAGWPMGIVAPLVLPSATESSIAGTLSGFLRVQSDPQKRLLSAQLDLNSPDLSVQLPELRLPENQIEVKANVALEGDGDLAIQKVMVASRQAGTDWLELSAEKAAQPGLAVVGKVDLGVLQGNVPAVAPYVSAGNLLLKANVGEPKDGLRKLGFSAEAQGLTLSLPEIGTIPGLKADAQGVLSWGVDGFAALDDLNLKAQSPGGELQLGKVDYRKNGALAWESARAPKGWMAILARPWLQPNSWVDGDVILGPGFWEPSDHGSSGQIDLLLEDGAISEHPSSAKIFCRLNGNWSFEDRIQTFFMKDASLCFTGADSKGKSILVFSPLDISSLEIGPGSLVLRVGPGGVLDLRGLMDQYKAWQPRSAKPGSSRGSARIDINADLDQVILHETKLDRLTIKALKFGPDEFLLDDFYAGVAGGAVTGSVRPAGPTRSARKILFEAKKLPLEALLAPIIRDARGRVGGFVDFEISGQAEVAKPQEFGRTFSGQGSLHVYQAGLQNVPAIRKSLLEEAGRSLGSNNFIPASTLDSFFFEGSLSNSDLSISQMQITGSALQLGLAGVVHLSTRELNLKGPLGLTREAIQSCGVLQGMVLKDNFANPNDLYVKMPGDLEVTGTLDNPTVNFDKLKAFWRGALNLGLGFIQGTGDAATGAAGAALGAPGTILQGVGDLFKGF